MRVKLIRLIYLTGWAILAWFALLPATALAQTPSTNSTGVITGRIVNGTQGAAIPPAGQIIKLQVVVANNDASNAGQTTSDVNGNFSFSNLATGDNYTYFVSTLYSKVNYYVTKDLKLTVTQPAQAVELKVYETTRDPSVVEIASNTLIIANVDAVSGRLDIFDVYNLKNQSDRTFIGQSSRADATPTASLRFYLPAGASNPGVAMGINPDELIETSGSIEITTPIVPGDSQLGVSYVLAYQETNLSFSKRLNYDMATFQVFSPISEPIVRSSQLIAGQSRQMGQARFMTLAGQNFKANQLINLEVSQLPLPPSKSVVATRNMILLILVPLLALLSGGFLIFYLRGRATSTIEPDFEQERKQLIQALAKLDFRYEGGKLDLTAAAYQRQRAELKTRLTEIWFNSNLESQHKIALVEKHNSKEEIYGD